MPDDELSALATLRAERACERLLLDYARAVDSGHASLVADLFTDDGDWLGSGGVEMRGRAAILDGFTKREALTGRRSRHVITNVVVDVDGPIEAHGIAYLINYRFDPRGRPEPGPAPADHAKFVGDYHLRFRCVEGVWKIAELRFFLEFLRKGRKD